MRRLRIENIELDRKVSVLYGITPLSKTPLPVDAGSKKRPGISVDKKENKSGNDGRGTTGALNDTISLPKISLKKQPSAKVCARFIIYIYVCVCVHSIAFGNLV